MKRLFRHCIGYALLVPVVLFAAAQQRTVDAPPESGAAARDTIRTDSAPAANTAASPDSITTEGAIGAGNMAEPDSTQPHHPPPASAHVVSDTEKPAEQASARKIKLIKREYNYRQQVLLAIGMMAFIAIMMTTAQSYNPK